MNLVSFSVKCFSLHGESSKNCKILIIRVHCCDPFPLIIFPGTNSRWVKIAVNNLRVLRFWCVCDYSHVNGILYRIICRLLVPMAAPSKTRTVFNLSNTGIMDSNPARGMDVCPRFSVLLSCVGSGLVTG
jgi:hypothetical protein